MLAMLDDVAATPVSLLIVPNFHYGTAAHHDRAFLDAIGARLARGDELVLHGCFHVDDAPPARTPGGWFARRMLTRGEGEFAVLDERAAAWRLTRGIALFERMRWPLAGFVPPAWLLSEGTRNALSHCAHRFDYVTIRNGMFRLPDWRFERTANLCYSPDTALRRAMSVGLIHHALRRSRATPLLRISLHPQDARVPAVMRHWRQLVVDALAERAPVTKREWAQRVKAQALPSPREGEMPGAPASADAGASPARAAS